MASSSEAYSSTPVHIKTLDILGQTKPFNKLTYAHLERFIDLAVKHYGCVEENETIDFLASRYGWTIQHSIKMNLFDIKYILNTPFNKSGIKGPLLCRS